MGGLSTGVTHILDFGPGGNDGVGGSANFAAQLTDGKGVQVIVCHADTVSRDDIPNIFGLSGAPRPALLAASAAAAAIDESDTTAKAVLGRGSVAAAAAAAAAAACCLLLYTIRLLIVS